MMKIATLRKMYDTFADVIYDVVQDNDASFSECFKILEDIAQGNIDGIRSAFRDGFSPMLVDGWNDDLNEIRIHYDNGDLLMVVCGEEINY